MSDREQLQALNTQLAYAAAHSAYYRETLGAHSALRSLEELRTLPLTDENPIKTQGSRLSCVSAASVARIVSLRSSGTTDRPKRLFFTEGDLQRTMDFFCEGMQWMTAPGDRVGIFFPGEAPDGLNDLLSRGLAAFGAVPTRYGEVSDAAQTAERLRRDRPDVLVGMPWQIRALAIFIPELRPRSVLLSADFVPETLRVVIAERWRCPVLTHYGLTESGYGLAVQHPNADGMYYRCSDFYLEVIDPGTELPVPCGGEGELVLTTLRREAMPLVRYRTGDRAVMLDEKRIARIPGRIGIADEFYSLQETLAPLPWLVDYAEQDGGLIANVTAEAPEACEVLLAECTGKETTLCKRAGEILNGGKRT